MSAHYLKPLSRLEKCDSDPLDEKMMKRIVTILAVLMISAVVVQAQLIWPTESKGIIFKKYGPKIETVKPPTGFTVTPVEVSEMFAPRKFMIMIYANGTHYFVTRYDRRQTLKKAQLFGVRINGKTGSVDKKSLDLKVLKPYKEIKKEKASNNQIQNSGTNAPNSDL